MTWLARLTFDDDASEATVADYLAAVQGLLQRRATLDTTIARLVPDSPYAATVPVLRCFRGIDTLSATGLCADIGDFARFAHPKLLAGFLGIVPSEYTSDDTPVRARSPRLARDMRAACWSRPPITTGGHHAWA